jgi:HSP20 family protein
MVIERWDPFREAISLQDAVNALFRESFIRPSSLLARDGTAPLPLDVSETGQEFVVKASLPGINPDDVQVSIQGETLTIRGESKAEEEQKGRYWHLRERWFGSFQRSISLPAPVDSGKAQASYEHGVLTLTLPKAEEAKPRQIKLGGSASTQIGNGKR